MDSRTDQPILTTISGVVARHRGRGHALGFPTVNVVVSEEVPEGIYIGFTTIEKKRLPSVVFIGRAITFNEFERFAESYILDFEGNLYEKRVSIDLIKKIRDNKKFPSREALVVRMKKDEAVARAYFKRQLIS